MFAGAFFDSTSDRLSLTGGQWYGWLEQNDFDDFYPAIDTWSISAPDPAFNRFLAPIAWDQSTRTGIQFGGYLADTVSYGPTGITGPLGDTRRFSSDGRVTERARREP